MKRKSLIAIGLAAVMTVSMTATAFAAEQQDFWTEYPNLTNYDTEFNYTLEQGVAATRQLMVQATSKDYLSNSLFETEEQAKEITWSMVEGSTSGVSVLNNGASTVQSVTEGEVTKYAAVGRTRVAANASAGVAAVEASNGRGGIMDFTIVVNPTAAHAVTEVSDVGVRVYGGKVGAVAPMYNAPHSTVLMSSYTGDGVNYPTVLDAIKGVAGENCSVEVNYGSPIVTKIGDFENNDETDAGWQYRVYAEETPGTGSLLKKTMVPLSEDVGAAVYGVTEGCVVVWAYGTYDENLFPDVIYDMAS